MGANRRGRSRALRSAVAALGAAVVAGFTFAAPTTAHADAHADVQAEPTRDWSVVGGAPAQGQAWMAALAPAAEPDLTRSQFCGGALIAPEWVLTAAHCLTPPPPDPTTLRLVIGRRDLAATDGDDNRAAEIIIHPDYRANTLSGSDIALIRLARPSPQAPLPFVQAGQEGLAAPGTVVSVVGWGQTNPDPNAPAFPDDLQVAGIPVRTDAFCSSFHVLARYYDARTMLCAGDPDVSPCSGDSGGPLVADDRGRPVAVGFVSWGPEECGSTPSVFARLTTLAPWVRASMRRPPAPVRRLAGSDRYATAAAISTATFQPGVAVAFVATGQNFPDALAGAAAARAGGGPVLLAARDTLPGATVEELRRLQPGRIVVLGGPAAVSDAVVARLASLTAGVVERQAGPDRFATAAAISAASFTPGARVAYVATAAKFPDALAAGAAGGATGGPVLLVQAEAVPAATIEELRRLQPAAIHVLGGAGAVSDAVVAQLRTLTAGAVGRSAGTDRFGTAVALSINTYVSPQPSVFLATGLDFPDALAGAAAAAGGPLLLTPGQCVPDAVYAEATRLKPGGVVVLGGTASLSVAVERFAPC